jgi:hypothetical protein
VVAREKIWSLEFADDLIIGKSEREMKEILKNLGKCLRKKKLEVNVEKKMIVFNKRKRKSEENE